MVSIHLNVKLHWQVKKKTRRNNHLRQKELLFLKKLSILNIKNNVQNWKILKSYIFLFLTLVNVKLYY